MGRSVGDPKADVLEGLHPVWMMAPHGYINGVPPQLTPLNTCTSASLDPMPHLTKAYLYTKLSGNSSKGPVYHLLHPSVSAR